MAKLNNSQLASSFAFNLAQSFGPFLSIDGGSFLFDTRPRKVPLWLGYNASPLFGLAQHLESWTGQRTERFKQVEKAYEELIERVKDNNCGQLLFDPPRTLDPAGVLYHYIALSIFDQFADEHLLIAKEIEERFECLVDKHRDLLKNTCVNGSKFEFGFDLHDNRQSHQFEAASIRAGIFSGPRSQMSHKFGFCLNLSYRKREMELFWQQLNLLLGNFRDDSADYPEVELEMVVDNGPLYDFHSALISAKVNRELSQDHRIEPFLKAQLSKFSDNLDFIVLDRASYRKHRSRILTMQSVVYEPARQSPPEEFDMLFESDNPLGILVLEGDELVAMSFAGKLGLFTRERGVIEDPFVNDPQTYYNMDLTVSPEFRGGLGRIMKQTMILLAVENGVTAIHGRNRDRLARGMWAINLSQGSYELQHLFDDYPDDERYRDCIYYRCPLEWDRVDSLDATEISRSIAAAVNGLSFSNAIVQDESQN